MHVRRRPNVTWRLGVPGALAASLVLTLATACGSTRLTDGAGPGAGLDGGIGATCGPGKAGCACSVEGQQVACGEVTNRDGDYVTCSEGTSTCKGGAWGPCIGQYTVFKSLGPLGGDVHTLGLPSTSTGDAGACASDPCDPSCQTFPNDNSNGVDGGPGLQATPDGGWTLPLMGGGTCTGLQCAVPQCAGGQTTSITGTVYDPAGLNPVFNAIVMIPNGPVQPIPPGVSSDPCGGAPLPPAVTYTYTAHDGTFTLTGVPTAKNVPLVIQIGRWRKITTIDTSTKVQCGQPVSALSLTGGSCNGNNNYSGSASCPTRLPRTQSEGNIPHIAIVTGACDPMECLLYRIGVDRTEFTDENGSGRIHVFQAHGAGLNSAANDHKNVLLGYDGYPGLLDNYDLVMLPCDCGYEYGVPHDDPGRANLVSYSGVGGRIFSSHWGREWIERASTALPKGPFPGVANWITDQGGNAATGVINTGTTYGQDFDAWMTVVGATTGATFTINPWREDTSSVTAASRLFVSYQSDGHPADFTFNTPVGAANPVGRVMFTDMHLSVDSSKYGASYGTMPSECVGQGSQLSAQEKAGEYLLFELGSCVTGTPPPPPQYSPATFTRDFPGTCPSGYAVKWRYFYWEDSTPSDSNIVFTAYTADTQAQLGTQFPAVPLATASGPDSCPGGPSCASQWVGVDVDPKLVAANQTSRSWLRVAMTLNPSSDKMTAPTLIAWQQTYDCVPAE